MKTILIIGALLAAMGMLGVLATSWSEVLREDADRQGGPPPFEDRARRMRVEANMKQMGVAMFAAGVITVVAVAWASALGRKDQAKDTDPG